MKAAASVRSSPGRPSAFSQDDILECALKLLDRDGVDALTLRGVARELGTVAGTVNYYYANLAELEDAIAARLLSELPTLDAQRRKPLRDQLVELGLALIAMHSRHPYVRQIVGD